MIAIPPSVVLALLLAVLLGAVLARRDGALRPVAGYLGLCIALLVVVGLRWRFDLPVLRALQPVVAALVPAAAWICLAPLRGGTRLPIRWHLVPPAGMLVCVAAGIGLAVDALLAALYGGYGVALIRIGLRGADGLPGARLTSAPSAGRAALLAGGILVFSGLMDTAIALDFGLGGGRHAAGLVDAGHLLMLPLIGALIVWLAAPAPVAEARPATGRSATLSETDVSEAAVSEAAAPPAPLDDALVLERLDRLLTERPLYRDPDLTLERLARRLGMPARQVSGAINRGLGRNVSQLINEWRIRDAMRRLDETAAPVTQIMFDCGFQTKSNFNREIRRVAGASPRDWRNRARTGAT